jgi:hypothetical protein
MDANGDAIAGLSGEQPYTGLGGSAGDQTIDALVVTRSAGHGFDSAHPQILTTGTQTGYLRALGMSPNGHAVAAIRADVNDESHPLVAQPNAVVVMTSASPGAAFANAHTLETVTATKPAGNPSVDTGDITRPDAAIDDAGDYAVEYNENVANGQPFDGFNTTVKVSLNGSAPGTSLNQPGIMSAAANGVLMDPTGQSVALLNETEPLQLMYESVRPAGGVFGAATSLDPSVLAPTAVANASNASGANGEIIYAADKQGTTSQDVDAMIGSAAGVFPPATTLSANDDNFGLGMGAAIDKTGDAAVTWRGGTTGTAVRVALTSSPGGGNPGGGNPGGGNPGGGNPGGGHPGGGGKNPPNTVITKKKVNKHTHSVEFTFKATGPSATGFDCALVKAPKHKSKKRSKPAYKSCESPKTYKHLAHGHYTFYARARNAAGEDKTPATASLRI